VTGYAPLQFRAYQSKLPLEFANIEPFTDLQHARPIIENADFLIASESGNSDLNPRLPTSQAADEILGWIRQSNQFSPIGQFSSFNGKQYFIFAHHHHAPN
jgi:hypothetical protein